MKRIANGRVDLFVYREQTLKCKNDQIHHKIGGLLTQKRATYNVIL